MSDHPQRQHQHNDLHQDQVGSPAVVERGVDEDGGAPQLRVGDPSQEAGAGPRLQEGGGGDQHPQVPQADYTMFLVC